MSRSAIELVAAGRAARPPATYVDVAAGLGLDDLGSLAESEDVEVRRHNHEKRLQAVLQPIKRSLNGGGDTAFQLGML